MLARTLRPLRIALPQSSVFGPEPTTGRGSGPISSPLLPPRFVIAIAASTGGPAALLDVFSRLPARLPVAILVAQHMPQRFTGAFAARLDKRSEMSVREAADGEMVLARNAYVCPGGSCMEIESNGGEMRVRVLKPSRKDAYVPSADRLFKSVARVAGARAVGVVLTGMGADGVEGARAIHDARGLVVVESQDTAVVDGMPSAVLRAGVAGRVLPLPAIGELLATLTK
jgi:two-component system chemotaxis response regulator CheB